MLGVAETYVQRFKALDRGNSGRIAFDGFFAIYKGFVPTVMKKKLLQDEVVKTTSNEPSSPKEESGNPSPSPSVRDVPATVEDLLDQEDKKSAVSQGRSAASQG